MGEKINKKKKEYNPLDDAQNLIGDILETQSKPNVSIVKSSKKKEQVAQESKQKTRSLSIKPEREESVIFKFKVSKKDLYEIKRIVSAMELQTDSNIDLSSIGRGWITRFITSEKELVDSARVEGRLKTPNRRDALEMSEFEHAMARIQARAFRRAGEI